MQASRRAHPEVFTDEGSTVPSALLNVKVTIPALAPPAVLSSHVTMCARYAPEMSERGRGAILNVA